MFWYALLTKGLIYNIKYFDIFPKHTHTGKILTLFFQKQNVFSLRGKLGFLSLRFLIWN